MLKAKNNIVHHPRRNI